MIKSTLTRDDIHDAIEALRRAQGQLEAALRIKDPAPAVLEMRWRRAVGEVRVLHCGQRRDRTSEEGRWGHE